MSLTYVDVLPRDKVPRCDRRAERQHRLGRDPELDRLLLGRDARDLQRGPVRDGERCASGSYGTGDRCTSDLYGGNG